MTLPCVDCSCFLKESRILDEREHKLNVLQSIISRMAGNSSNCKLWCITISAAFLAFYFQGQSSIELDYRLLLLPVIPFLFLDAYYLSLEKLFRKQYNELLTNKDKLTGGINSSSWYAQILPTIRAFGSFSVWGFYLVLGATIFLILASVKVK